MGAKAIATKKSKAAAEVAAQPPGAAPQRIRGGSTAGVLRYVDPVYPPLARQARIQGVVRLNVIVAKDGAPQNISVVSGHPLLVPAAMEAVRQWQWHPALVNGQPVEIVTQVDVPFSLQ